MRADRPRWNEIVRVAHRRDFLQQAGGGLGAVALSWLLAQDAARASDDLSSPSSTRPPHFPARATSVIYLFMHGGPSHLDTFDPKPELTRLAGQPLPPDVVVSPPAPSTQDVTTFPRAEAPAPPSLSPKATG